MHFKQQNQKSLYKNKKFGYSDKLKNNITYKTITRLSNNLNHFLHCLKKSASHLP